MEKVLHDIQLNTGMKNDRETIIKNQAVTDYIVTSYHHCHCLMKTSRLGLLWLSDQAVSSALHSKKSMNAALPRSRSLAVANACTQVLSMEPNNMTNWSGERFIFTCDGFYYCYWLLVLTSDNHIIYAVIHHRACELAIMQCWLLSYGKLQLLAIHIWLSSLCRAWYFLWCKGK